VGWRLTWIAVPNGYKSKLLEDLGLIWTGEYEDLWESDANGVNLPDGGYLVIANGSDNTVAPEDTARTFSRLNAVDVVRLQNSSFYLTVAIVMFRAGEIGWAIRHSQEPDGPALRLEGEVPAQFRAMIAVAMDRQKANDADYLMDIPTEVGRSLTRFAHNGWDFGEPETMFEVLETLR
jgi:hypothetical protein